MSVGHPLSSGPYTIEIVCYFNVYDWFCLVLQCVHLCLIFRGLFYRTMQLSLRKLFTVFVKYIYESSGY